MHVHTYKVGKINLKEKTFIKIHRFCSIMVGKQSSNYLHHSKRRSRCSYCAPVRKHTEMHAGLHGFCCPFRLILLSSVKLFYKHSHRNNKRCISMVIRNLVKLILETKHHTEQALYINNCVRYLLIQ